MAERVLDEVADRLFDAKFIGVDDQFVGCFDDEFAALLGCPQREPLFDGVEEFVDRNECGSYRQPTLVEAGDDEEVLGELHEPVGLLGRGVNCVAELLDRTPRSACEFELTFEDRERGAKLVARVGHE